MKKYISDAWIAGYYQMGPELSWLERTTDNREVGGSSPLGPTTYFLLKRKVSKENFKLRSKHFAIVECFDLVLKKTGASAP